MCSDIITYQTYQTTTNKIEDNLKENLKLSLEMLHDFKEQADEGSLTDLSFVFVLEKNVENAKSALLEYQKLPISGYIS